MADAKALTTKNNGALFVQPGGPNTPVYWIGCNDLGDIVENYGSVELIRCFDKNGMWKTVGSTQAPPDAITTSIEGLTSAVRDYLDQLNCRFTLYAMLRQGGEANVFSNYVRGTILNNARVTSLTEKSIVHHEEDQPSMTARDIEAWPPAYRVGSLTARRQTTSETLALNDVVTYSPLDCDNRISAGDKAVAGADSSSYAGNVLRTLDQGVTWSELVADPFAAGKNILSLVAFPISESVTRILAAQEAANGAQGKIAYTDDGGATWTTVNIGGATAGHGAVDSGALFALDQGHIWLASAKGYVYFSSDGGATWTAQTSGTLSIVDLHAVSFYDENNGMAGGATDIIFKTSDGGDTWELTDAVTGTGGDITCVAPSGEFWWVGTDDGKLFYSRDDGDTWTERSFSGSGTGAVTDIAWANELVGYAIHNSAAPVGEILVTINGGYTWKAITTPTNAGLNSLSIADVNTLYAVGEVEGGTAVIIKVTWG